MKKIKNVSQFKKGIIVYIVVIVLGILVCLFRAATSTNHLDKVVFHSELLFSITKEFKGIGWWPITHFIMYLCLGIVAPSYWWLWYSIGILWELFEHSVGKYFKKKENPSKISKKLFFKHFEKNKDEEYMYGPDNWVRGTYTDLIFNGGGLIIGIIISQIIKKFSNKENKKNKENRNVKIIFN